MNRLRMITMCLLAMMAASLSVKAQEVTITLFPGWNWISYPNAVSMEISEALGTFTPMNGDKIKGQFSNSAYTNGYWRGGVTHFMPGMGYMYYSSRSDVTSFVFAMTSNSIVETDTITNITAMSATVGSTVTIGEGNHIFVRGVCWSTEPNPNIDGSHTTDASVTGSLSDTLTELSPGTTFYVRAYVVTDYGLAYGEELSFTTENDGGSHDYVDLGLPSGLLWATCNVGANTPDECGDYFAWGETEPKDYYYWNTYQFCNGNDTSLTKYCTNSYYGYNGFTDNRTILLPEDDAATANWGEDWRMPTQDEWQELYNNTTSTWTTQNGVNGRLFTASNGNSLFLPAAGYLGSSGLHYLGSSGSYWSRSLFSISHNAFSFRINSNNCYTDNGGRSNGCSVRPVRSVQNITFYSINAVSNTTEGGSVIGSGTYEENTNCILTATANQGYVFTNWTENGVVVSTSATYTFTVNSDRNLVANFANNNGHSYVDLGLPSGLLWATCNIGASSPKGYGYYYAWGETLQKDYYSWTNYQYCMGVGDALTKYCSHHSYGYNGFTDNLTTLLPEDDAATVRWGGNWRMPSRVEWQELYQNTTPTWTTQNGVKGILFTATNGNTLFIPAAGYRDTSLEEAGSVGYYWSSSRYPTYSYCAWSFKFITEDWQLPFNYNMNSDARYKGMPIRPVLSAN